MSQSQRPQPLITSDRIERSLQSAQLLQVNVDFGPGMPLAVAINAWTHSAMLFRDIAFSGPTYNPFDRTPDDFVGALYLRQAIHKSLTDAKEGEEPFLPLLVAADEIHCAATAVDERGVVLSLTGRDKERFRVRPDWWWWHRFPGEGAIADAVRDWTPKNPQED